MIIKVLRNQEVVARKEGEEWVLFNPQTSAIHIVSYVGYEIFDSCNGEKGRKDIADAVLDKLQIENTTENQVLIDQFFEELIRRDIVREVKD